MLKLSKSALKPSIINLKNPYTQNFFKLLATQLPKPLHPKSETDIYQNQQNLKLAYLKGNIKLNDQAMKDLNQFKNVFKNSSKSSIYHFDEFDQINYENKIDYQEKMRILKPNFSDLVEEDRIDIYMYGLSDQEGTGKVYTFKVISQSDKTIQLERSVRDISIYAD